MPYTEIITPTLKTASASIEGFKRSWPNISQPFATNPNIKTKASGWIIEENDNDVKKDCKICFLLEWVEHSAFQDFLISPEFNAFRTQFIPFVATPSKPHFFETNNSPANASAAPLTEIIRTSIATSGSARSAEQAWEELVKQTDGLAVGSTHGKSLNLDEEMYIGVLGWESMEARKRAQGKSSFLKCLEKLREVGNTSAMVVELVALKLIEA